MKFISLSHSAIGLPNELNADCMSPLHLAVVTDDPYIVHELVQGGGDPMVGPGGDHPSPFQLAIDMKKDVALEYFLHMSRYHVDESKGNVL